VDPDPGGQKTRGSGSGFGSGTLLREMEYISRSPTFGDFVTILTERSMQDITVERARVIFTAIAITRKIYSVTVH
jgi:hypothetical protein